MNGFVELPHSEEQKRSTKDATSDGGNGIQHTHRYEHDDEEDVHILITIMHFIIKFSTNLWLIFDGKEVIFKYIYPIWFQIYRYLWNPNKDSRNIKLSTFPQAQII